MTPCPACPRARPGPGAAPWRGTGRGSRRCPRSRSTTSAPPVRWPEVLERARTGAARPAPAGPGSTATSAPSSLGQLVAGARTWPPPAARRARSDWRRAAMVVSPSVPAAEHGHGVARLDARPPGRRARRRPWARPSRRRRRTELVGHGWSWPPWATRPTCRPSAPGVGAEPDLQPRGEMAEGDPLASARATLGAGRAGRDDAAGDAAEHGLDHHPGRRRRHPPVGRAGASITPTTSWPGTKGKLTMSSKYRELRPSRVARSEPQMPASTGWTRCQPGPGSSGGSTSVRRSGPDRRAPCPSPRRPRPAGTRRSGAGCARRRGPSPAARLDR